MFSQLAIHSVLFRFAYMVLILGIILAKPCYGSQNIVETFSAEKSLNPTHLQLSNQQVTVDVVGFSLRGRVARHQVSVFDFDMFTTDKGLRYIPFLRLLNIFQAEGKLTDHQLSFSIDKVSTYSVEINVAANEFTILSNGRQYAMISGVSEVTGEQEIYLPEETLGDLFGFDYQWNDAEYTYFLTTKKKLRVFPDDKMSSIDFSLFKKITENLPVTESIRMPANSREWLSFIDAGIRLDGRVSKTASSSKLRPDVSLYGQIFNGSYVLRLAENIDLKTGRVPKAPLWFNRGLWFSKSQTANMRIGDTNVGLSHLIVPSASFTGLVVRGIAGGISDKNRNVFLNNSRFNFVSEVTFDGFEQLGATVRLFINGRLVDTVLVEDTKEAPPGQGRYVFSGVGLLSKRVNEIRIAVENPDGSIDEYRKTLLGASDLLPEKQGAYSMGFGTKRKKLNDGLNAEGIFGGVGFYYGISRFATLGMVAAYQDDFFKGAVFNNPSTQEDAPQRVFLGESLTLKMLENLIVKGAIAANFIENAPSSPRARDVSVDYGQENILLSSTAFSYDKDYTNGSRDIGDRKGYSLFGEWRNQAGFSLQGSAARIQKLSNNQQEDFAISELNFPTLNFWTTKFRLRVDSVRKNLPNSSVLALEKMYSSRVNFQPARFARFNAEYVWGDAIDNSSEGSLRSGLSFPLMGSTFSFGLKVESKFSIGRYNRLSFDFRDPKSGQKNAGVTFQRVRRTTGVLDFILRYRYDLQNKQGTANLDFDYPLNVSRRNVIGGGITYSEASRSFTANVNLTVSSLFFPGGGRINRIPNDWRINPRVGGIKGLVYLDVNANGHHEPGEPGIPHMTVLVDGRQTLMSDDNGFFFTNRRSFKDRVILSLDLEDIPAIYTPTQGAQEAIWEEHIFTQVKLGVSALGSISGVISVSRLGQPVRELPGAMVLLIKVDDGQVVGRSIADSGGGYYFGELRPGKYRVDIDPMTVPSSYRIADEKPEITLETSFEPDDIENINFRLEFKGDRNPLLELDEDE